MTGVFTVDSGLVRGWRRYRHFPAGKRLVTAGFLHEKGQLVLLFRWHFLCDVMSNSLQNHECNILPHMSCHM